MNIPVFFLIFLFSFLPSEAFGREKFSPSNCEFSISFPSQYAAQQGFGPSGARFDVASWELRGSFLKAECLNINHQTFLGDNAKNTLLQAAKAFGLYGFTVTLSNKNVGKIATLTGYKNIQGMNATYQISFFVGRRTALIVYTGAESQKYPTKEISDFIKSIGLAQK